MTAEAIAALFTLLASGACGYYLLVIAAAARFDRHRRRSTPAGEPPPVSLLKPLCGLDDGLEANLRSHFEQEGVEFELIFVVADADDAALSVVEALSAQYPLRPLETVVARPSPGGNPKVALLEAATRSARHGVLVVSDADIRVPPNWLRTVAAPFGDPALALTTCLYRARPGRTLASRLDALWISTDFPGQALLAAALSAGPKFALGATMAVRRADLEALGGFEALRPYLNDDYQLGARAAALGRRTVLTTTVVETTLGDPGWGEVWRRRLRWARTIRVSRPLGHAGFLTTFGTVWALAGIVVGAPTALAAACLALRYASAWCVARRVTRADLSLGVLALTPAAELWSFAVWAASFAGRTVLWRGRRLRLDRRGRILDCS